MQTAEQLQSAEENEVLTEVTEAKRKINTSKPSQDKTKLVILLSSMQHHYKCLQA